MNALIYLTKRTLINRTKQALKKPTSLLVIIFGCMYAFFIFTAIIGVVMKARLDSPKMLLVAVTVWTLYITLIGLHSIVSRKCVSFKPYHTHFVFPAPINPKVVLLHGGWLEHILGLFMGVLFFVVGITVFQIEIWRMLLYVFVCCVLETIVETGLTVCIYANERMSEKTIKRLCRLIKIALALITLYIFMHFKTKGASIDSVFSFIDLPGLQMIPVVGWNIAIYRLVLIGPTMLNVVCSLLYVLTVFTIFILAKRMKCAGEYYEDASKFADNLAELKEASKNGKAFGVIRGKKKQYREIVDGLKGTGARAIFYRQILEYRKEKFFIFTKTTFMVLVGAVIGSQIFLRQAVESGGARFYLLGFILYATIVLSSALGKWENELKSHYLFLIPDSPIKKLWYATLMDYVTALVDGSIFCIIIGVTWKIHPVQIVCCILVYTTLQVQRIYIQIIVQCVLGNTFGKKVQETIRVLMQMFFMGGGIGVAIFAGTAVNLNLVFPIILIYSIMVTVIVGLLASIRFGSMEQTG